MITLKLKTPIERTVRAVNGEEVQELATTFQFPDYNFYVYNTMSGTWDFYSNKPEISNNPFKKIINYPDMSINASEISSIIRS